MFSLPGLKTLALVETPYQVELSPVTVFLLLAALGYAEDLGNWAGEGLDLTPAEIDEIRAMVATATDELLPE